MCGLGLQKKKKNGGNNLKFFHDKKYKVEILLGNKTKYYVGFVIEETESHITILDPRFNSHVQIAKNAIQVVEEWND